MACSCWSWTKRCLSKAGKVGRSFPAVRVYVAVAMTTLEAPVKEQDLVSVSWRRCEESSSSSVSESATPSGASRGHLP